MPDAVRVAPEVADAVAEGRPVVALESTLLAHGLPAPDNRAVAAELEDIVRAADAVPATVAVLDGTAAVGLTPDELDRVCGGGLAKLSGRDLGVALGLRLNGATTVAATCQLARLAGISVFGTGGLGGVHRGARESWASRRTSRCWPARRCWWSAPGSSRCSTCRPRWSNWRPCRSLCSPSAPMPSPGSTSGIPAAVVRGGWTDRPRWPRWPPRTGRWGRRPGWWWPIPFRTPTSWTASCTTGCWPRAWRWPSSAACAAAT